MQVWLWHDILKQNAAGLNRAECNPGASLLEMHLCLTVPFTSLSY